VALTEAAIRPEVVLEGLSSSSDGAVLLFLGVVRDENEGRRVEGLVYEAYREMAEETLASIAREAGARFGTDRIALLHRVGALRVGEVSTAIAVATPHRKEAYEASRYIIEEIKQRLPIWKRERYAEGGEGWVAGTVPAAAGSSPGEGSGGGSGEGGRRERGEGAGGLTSETGEGPA